MGELADRLDRLTVQVSSPDQQITVHLDGRGGLADIQLSTSAYRRYATADLARQLRQLARLASVAYRRAFRELVDEVFTEPVYDDSPDEVGPELPKYRHLLPAIVSRGQAGDGAVQISARGLADWEVRLTPGLPQRLPADVFLEHLRAAVEQLLADHNAQATEARQQVYRPIESAIPLNGRNDGAPLDRLRYNLSRAIRVAAGQRGRGW